LTNLLNLEILDLSFNQIETIPAEIGSLTSLVYLSIESNKITTLPSEMFNLLNLQELSLKYNKITSIPSEIGNLESLNVLLLDHNQITTIPVEIGKIPKVNLSFNEINSIPSELSNHNLDLSNNPIAEERVSVYLYNAIKNKCLRTTGDLNTPLTYGTCDNSENIVWTIPTTHIGKYRSKINPDYCISMEDGNESSVISLQYCNSENSEFGRDGNLIKASTNNLCLGSSKDSNEVVQKACDENDQDQIWYFNNWDSSIVFEEEPEVIIPGVLPPVDVTIYFYNAYNNKCITTDGSTVTTGDCFNNEGALWEIPVSHDGYYRPKSNPEKCLSIVDGAVTLSECNDDTTLYRDGNFIRSPSSDDYCIASSEVDDSLKYLKGCNENNSDHIWYFNVWTAPETESTETDVTTETSYLTPAVVPTETMDSIVTVVPTETVDSTEIAVPTETVDFTEIVHPATVTEENPTVTITTTVTAIMTEN